MFKKQRARGLFTWVPMHNRRDKLGLPVQPRPEDHRIPIFWLQRSKDDLFFINDSDEVLLSVSATSSGFTTDDEAASPIQGNQPARLYQKVLPGEAVKVDQYHPVNDSDYMLNLVLDLVNTKRGVFQLVTHAERMA